MRILSMALSLPLSSIITTKLPVPCGPVVTVFVVGGVLPQGAIVLAGQLAAWPHHHVCRDAVRLMLLFLREGVKGRRGLLRNAMTTLARPNPINFRQLAASSRPLVPTSASSPAARLAVAEPPGPSPARCAPPKSLPRERDQLRLL